MIFSVHLLRGLRDPSKFFVHLNRSSTINGFWSRLILILITYLLIGFFQAYLGIGMEELMVEWETTSNEKIEVAKIFMGIWNSSWEFTKTNYDGYFIYHRFDLVFGGYNI